jgi:crotonobetainyl-CoA:carnitine CoA-transferase CaiB-like acyl-CoA transferase
MGRGLHWRTFFRLQAEYDGLVQNYLVGSMARLGLLQGQIEKMMDRLPE